MKPTDAPHGERRPGSDDGADDDWVAATTGSDGFRTDVTVGHHVAIADEPTDAGGSDAGPTPYAYLLVALASCTAMTLRMYAARKEWPLERVIVRLRDTHSHASDCENCETRPVGLRRLDRKVELEGALTDEQRHRLMIIADRCPVKQTLARGIEIADVS